MKSIISCLLMMAGIATTAMAQNIQNNANSNHGNKFEQMGGIFYYKEKCKCSQN